MQDFFKYTDEELLKIISEQIAHKSDSAFNVLYERYAAKLNLFCVFKSKNQYDAEEVFEDTWLKFLLRVRNGKIPNSTLAYLYSIARNLIIDRYNDSNSSMIEFRDFMENEADLTHFNLEKELENQELIEIVKNVLATLDDIYSESFMLQWFGGLSQKEIADALGISLSAVKMRNMRAMKEVVKYVKPLYSDAE